MSDILRIVAFLLGLLLIYVIGHSFFDGTYAKFDFKILIFTPVMGIAFLAYAMGGQEFLQKIVPTMAEKDKTAGKSDKN